MKKPAVKKFSACSRKYPAKRGEFLFPQIREPDTEPQVGVRIDYFALERYPCPRRQLEFNLNSLTHGNGTDGLNVTAAEANITGPCSMMTRKATQANLQPQGQTLTASFLFHYTPHFVCVRAWKAME
jgi:hypothetical protein